MAITEIKETFDGRGGSKDRKGHRHYERVFFAKTNSIKDGAQVILTDPLVPKIGDIYASGNDLDTGAWCSAVRPQQNVEEPSRWTVTVEYTSEPGESFGAAEDPLLRPADIAWGFVQFQRLIEKDINGKELTNSAGDPFLPPPTGDQSRPVLSITKNMPFFDPTRLTYIDAVNTDFFLGVAAGRWKCSAITSQRLLENGRFFWRTAHEFHYSEIGWKLEPLDRGLNKLVAGKRERILDNGLPVVEPVKLDGAGQPLAATAAGVYRSFKIYRELPFAALGLP